MTGGKLAVLSSRGVVSVTGPDTFKLLQGLVTNDIDLLETQPALFAALLSPQGKILFEFFCVKVAGGVLLDVARDKCGELSKRLAMYKLRADVQISDVSDTYRTLAVWGASAAPGDLMRGSYPFSDPRHDGLGIRILAKTTDMDDIVRSIAAIAVQNQSYDALRVALGIPQIDSDYAYGDVTPHEANFDLINGVSFTKGCYVGQEVVARMHNKTVVRKRVARIAGSGALLSGTDILLGEAPIGRVGTVDDKSALALVRLDRAIEALDKSVTLTAGGIDISVDDVLLNAYRNASTSRPSASGLT